MPRPGDHLRPSPATANPFVEPTPRMNEYTAVEIATLQSRLDKQLGPEYISTRPGAGGGKVHYLAAEKVINLANEVFGFNGWSSEVKQCDVDFVDEHPETHKISLGMAVVVRVTLRDGTFHEDMGYGHIENCKSKAAAFEKARKEAVTDALKRALRSFGKVLGNCLYDKDYLARVSKIKVQPSRWDEKRLHRHPDYLPAPVKQEAPDTRPPEEATTVTVSGSTTRNQISQGTDIEDDFGGSNLFDGVELGPDEVLVPGDSANTTATFSRPQSPMRQPPLQNQQQQPRPRGPLRNVSLPANNPSAPAQNADHYPKQPPEPMVTDMSEPSFVTSRAAVNKDGELSASEVAALPRFNPSAESPSIRKTSGVNHAASTPIKRANLPNVAAGPGDAAGPPPGPPGQPSHPMTAVSAAPARNFVHPGADPARRVGMPSTGTASPMPNRSAFKQPGPASVGTKRPAASEPGTHGGRSPLGDVSNLNGPATRGDSNGGKSAGEKAASGTHGTGEDPAKRTRTAA